MSERATRRATVLRTRWLTRRMIQVVLGGPGLTGFETGPATDSYVKLVLTDPGSGRPGRRTYTVRRWDASNGELTINFVHHGESGLAGPWAAAAAPGDAIELAGPGGQYAPDPAADWHLLVGDTSALPAIAAALERLPPEAHARVVLEIDDPGEQQQLRSAADLDVTWLDRSRAGTGETLLAETLREAELPLGRVHAFVHGEAASVRAVRRHLLIDRGVDRADLSVSGYWKRGRDEEGWRADKPEWQRQAAADEQLVSGRP